MRKAGAFVEQVKADKNAALKVKRVEGTWNLQEGKPQFTALLEHSQGTTAVEADGPEFLGGSGVKPDPIQYCLFGLAACFAQTFASIAAEKGVNLEKLRVSVENRVNLSKALGLGEDPIVEGVTLSVEAKSNGNADLNGIKELAVQRCPGVYCLTNPIPLKVELL